MYVNIRIKTLKIVHKIEFEPFFFIMNIHKKEEKIRKDGIALL